MAKPITYSKRDNEKKKQDKRTKKLNKKEERKTLGKSSFEEMIAYVDENGVITSTPPQPSKKDHAEGAHNESTTPVKTNKSPAVIKGRVEYLNAEKGFGFIKEIAKTNKYFFHVSSIKSKIQINDLVSFEVERSKKGLNAVNIQIES